MIQWLSQLGKSLPTRTITFENQAEESTWAQNQRETLNQSNKAIDKWLKDIFIHLNITLDGKFSRSLEFDGSSDEMVFIKNQYPHIKWDKTALFIMNKKVHSIEFFILPIFKVEPFFHEYHRFNISPVSFLVNQKKPEKIWFPLDISEAQENLKYSSAIRNLIKYGVPALVLWALLIIGISKSANYFLNEKITEEHQKQNIVTQINGIKDEINLKQSIYLSNRNNSEFYYAQLMNELFKATPNNISFKQCYLNPITSKIDKQSEIEFNTNVILIEGYALKTNEIYSFIENLKELKWAYSVELDDLQFDKFKKQSNFKISIQIV